MSHFIISENTKLCRVDKYRIIFAQVSMCVRMTLCSIHRSCFTATLGLSVYFSRDVAAWGALQCSFENVSAFKLADQDRWSTFAQARIHNEPPIDRPIDRAASLIELMPNFWPPSSKRLWLLSFALTRARARSGTAVDWDHCRGAFYAPRACTAAPTWIPNQGDWRRERERESGEKRETRCSGGYRFRGCAP